MAGFSPSESSPILPREHPEFPLEIQTRMLCYIHAMMQHAFEELETLDRIFEHSPPKLIYGLDDHDSAFCLWTAATAHGIPIYGHQHGCISKIQPGWMRNHLSREDNNVRFTRLFVWGDYWKKKILQYSNLYDEASLEIGGHMRPSSWRSSRIERKTVSDKPLILVPAEYLSDRIAIGHFLDRMIDEKNWRVVLKVRPDEPFQEQVESYEMKYQSRLEIVEYLSDDFLATVSAVAGCQSTMLFEVLAGGIPAWYFKTKFTMHEDMVSDGLAHEINDSILDGNCDHLFKSRFQEDSSILVNAKIKLDELLTTLMKKHQVL